MTTFLPPNLCSGGCGQPPEPQREYCFRCAAKESVYSTIETGRIGRRTHVVAIVGVVVTIVSAVGITDRFKKDQRPVDPPRVEEPTIGPTVVPPPITSPPDIGPPLSVHPPEPQPKPATRSEPNQPRRLPNGASSKMEKKRIRSAGATSDGRISAVSEVAPDKVEPNGVVPNGVVRDPSRPIDPPPEGEESDSPNVHLGVEVPAAGSVEITPVTDTRTPQFEAETTVTAFREHARPRRGLEFPWPELRWPALDDRCVTIEVTIDPTGAANACVIDGGGVPPGFVERALQTTAGRWYPAISADGEPVADVVKVRYCWFRGKR